MHKKGELASLIVIGIMLVITAILIITKGGITGAEVGVPEILEENISEDQLKLPIETLIPSPIENESLKEINNESISIPTEVNNSLTNINSNESNLTISANCAVWPCNCGDTLTASVTMTSSLTGCTAGGLNIGAQRITLDCGGYSIIGSSVGSAFEDNGIYDYGNSFSIKNCVISNFTYGIRIIAGSSNISSNNISNNTYGIGISSTSGLPYDFNNITNNNIIDNNYAFDYTHWSDGALAENNWFGVQNCTNISLNVSGNGILDFDPYLNASYPGGSSINCPAQYCGLRTNSTVILTANLTDCPGFGISMQQDNITLNCQGYSISSAGPNLKYGILAYGSKSGTIKDNNTVTNCMIKNFYGGIYFEEMENAFIINNTLINNTRIGINFSNSDKNLITNNTITKSNGTLYPSGGAVYLENTDNNIFRTNNITNNSHGFYMYNVRGHLFENNYVSGNSLGYYVPAGSWENNITADIITYNGRGILFNSSSGALYNNLFKDTIFGNNVLDLNLLASISGNITFTNSSVNKSRIYVSAGGTAYFNWYVDVNITDSNGNFLNNINIKAYDPTGKLMDINTTNSNGISRLILTEFFRKGEINYYTTPGTIEASFSNYTKNSTTINLVNQTYALVNLTITPVICGSTINSDFTFKNNYICAGNGIIVGVGNITINGNGSNLTGNGSNIGIDLNGKNEVKINHLQIQNFTKALNLQYANNTNLTSLRIVNNSVGIYLESSTNNYIYDSNLGNNTNVSIYAVSEGITSTSLANSSIKDFNEINVSSASTIFFKWYVDVNATFFDQSGNRNVLPNGNVSGYFNSTITLDASTLTESNGIGRLILSEFKKNTSGINYLTPHTINLTFTSSSGTGMNSTSINLTQTNNILINLNLTLDCISPASYGYITITDDTVLCPGTFNIEQIRIEANGVNLTCDNTVLVQRGYSRYDSTGISISSVSGINITGCTLNGFNPGIDIRSSRDIIINDTTIDDTGYAYSYGIGIESSYSKNILINNSHFLTYVGMRSFSDNNTKISNTIFEGTIGLDLLSSLHGIFNNNRFSGLWKAITFDSRFPSGNNSFYKNNFSSSTQYNIEYFNITGTSYLNHFNTSSAGYAQGNEYSDYCDKGSDLNSDGYADNDSSSSVDDWPYSENISTKISDSTANNGGVIDYGPKITTCPAAEVFLGNTGGSSSASTSAPAAAPAAAPPPGFSTYEKPAEKPAEDFSTLEEIKKHLKTDEIIVKRTSEDTMQVAIKLENNGDQKMKLFPGLDQETEVPLYIVTKKTVGGEGSFFNKLSGIAYSENTIAGKLLQAEIIGAEEFILNPGESVEKILEIKDALIPPKQIKIKFSSFGETVTEQEIKVEPKKVLTGSALDIDTEQDLIDVYAIMVPEKNGNGESGENGPNNDLTGAAVGPKDAKSNLYYLEIKLTKKGSDKDAFVDWYGPYHTKPGQNFIFAQQFKYGQPFRGDYLLKTKIFRGNELVTEAEHGVKLE